MRSRDGPPLLDAPGHRATRRQTVGCGTTRSGILLARRFDHAVSVAQSFAVAARASRDLLNGGQCVLRIQSDGGHASILKDETDID